MGAARERVRVARRLSELALVTAAFSSGELSYSKVRAITRVATDANEAMLVDLARAMTASHLERVVRCYRLAGADPENDTDPVDHYRDGFLSTQWNDDGSLTIRAKLPPAEGAMVIEALRRAADTLYRDRQRRQRSRSAKADDVSAETSNEGRDDLSADRSDEDWATWDQSEGDGLATDVSAETSGSETAPRDADKKSPAPWDGWGAAQADALVAMAETVVADGLRSGGGPGRHLVIVHTDADTATGQADRTAAYLDNGPRLAAETVRRLMCDSSLAFALEGPDGTVINLSSASAQYSDRLGSGRQTPRWGVRLSGVHSQRFRRRSPHPPPGRRGRQQCGQLLHAVPGPPSHDP